mmetsp:Transcript_15397/g.39053  ORF Transcript_15397/g.39053 Transcript_15397/m.39053 type:complete len:274 (+) Transcript_15397:46-867(+)
MPSPCVRSTEYGTSRARVRGHGSRRDHALPGAARRQVRLRQRGCLGGRLEAGWLRAPRPTALSARPPAGAGGSSQANERNLRLQGRPPAGLALSARHTDGPALCARLQPADRDRGGPRRGVPRAIHHPVRGGALPDLPRSLPQLPLGFVRRHGGRRFCRPAERDLSARLSAAQRTLRPTYLEKLRGQNGRLLLTRRLGGPRRGAHAAEHCRGELENGPVRHFQACRPGWERMAHGDARRRQHNPHLDQLPHNFPVGICRQPIACYPRDVGQCC